ncbi:MAG: AAA family ATPase [Flavobacteriales bacterium]|nr:AAA family ATPase [Flavobacteriales bacterium]
MDRPFIIGIAGGSGSGKTTLIRLIQAELGSDHVTVVSQDDYYHPIEKQSKDPNGEVNFDLPDSIDSSRLKTDMERLIHGKRVEIARYTFNNQAQLAEPIVLEPRRILVVEGLFVFHYPFIRPLFDIKVFVDAHVETRFERRLKRDLNERGYPEETVRYQWEHHVEPAFRNYLLPHREQVDILIDNEYDMREAIPELIERIQGEETLRISNRQ